MNCQTYSFPFCTLYLERRQKYFCSFSKYSKMYYLITCRCLATHLFVSVGGDAAVAPSTERSEKTRSWLWPFWNLFFTFSLSFLTWFYTVHPAAIVTETTTGKWCTFWCCGVMYCIEEYFICLPCWEQEIAFHCCYLLEMQIFLKFLPRFTFLAFFPTLHWLCCTSLSWEITSFP